MTVETADQPTPDQTPGSGRARARSVRRIQAAMRRIAVSDEPAVVLSSLARRSIACFSDRCAVELSEGTDPLFRVSFPAPGATASPASSASLTTTVHAPAGHGYPSFAGVVVHSWTGYAPTEDDAIIARLLVDRALAVIDARRLALSAARAEDRAAKLAIDLITGRIEGQAIGILTAKHHITVDEADRLLRRASRASQRQTHEVAADVARTGDLPCLPERRTSPPRRDRRSTASGGQTVFLTRERAE